MTVIDPHGKITWCFLCPKNQDLVSGARVEVCKLGTANLIHEEVISWSVHFTS